MNLPGSIPTISRLTPFVSSISKSPQFLASATSFPLSPTPNTAPSGPSTTGPNIAPHAAHTPAPHAANNSIDFFMFVPFAPSALIRPRPLHYGPTFPALSTPNLFPPPFLSRPADCQRRGRRDRRGFFSAEKTEKGRRGDFFEHSS